MSRMVFTRGAAPSTPAADKSAIYVDTADRRLKQLDDNGVISILGNSGPKEMNVVMNGGFSVQQKVAVASTAISGVSATTRAGVVADRWSVTVGNVTTPSWQQVDSSTAAIESGLESRYYGKITQATNAAKFILSQFIEHNEMSHLRGKKVRLSCKIKQFAGSAANFRLGLLQLAAAGTVDTSPAFITAIGADNVEPTWGTNLALITPDASPTPENATVSGSALQITGTANWVKSSGVFTIPTDAKNLVVVIYRSTVGGINDATGIAEVQMTQGPDIVDWVSMPFDYEYGRCLRYYAKSFPYATVPAASIAVATAGTGSASIIGKAGATALAVHIDCKFPVKQRLAAPTITLFTPVNAGAVPMRIDGTTPAVQTAVAQVGPCDTGVLVTATGDINGAVGDLVGVHWTVSSEFVA